MSDYGSFNGRVSDAAAGPIGSREWVESRAARIEGFQSALTDAEKEEMVRRFRAVSAVRPSQTTRPAPGVSGSPVLFESGAVARIGDYDDQTETPPVESAAKVARAIAAEKVFRSLCDDETGVMVDPVLLAKKTAEKAILRDMSHEIAGKLERAGVPAYRDSEWCLWTYGIHSGEVEAVPNFRRVAFIPYVAAAIRAPMLRALEFYLQKNAFCRFWTMTGGPRVSFFGLRTRIREIQRRLSTLNAQPFMKAVGAQIVFRSTELGTVEKTRRFNDLEKKLETLGEDGTEAGALERDEAGKLWFHPHAHCVVKLAKGRIPAAQWSAFLERVWSFWGHHWQDGDEQGGPIRNARELVKYVSKPGDVLKMTEKETRVLFKILRRAKLVQPMGELAEEIKCRDEAGKTLVRMRTKDGFVWTEVDNWNSREPSREEIERVDPHAAFPDFIGPMHAEGSQRDAIAGFKLSAADADCCVVVARCVPSASKNGLKEARVFVMGKRWDAERVKSHPLVKRLRLATFEAWHAGLALAAGISVHTGTPTVREADQFSFFPDVPERVRPPGEPVFAQPQP